ncbi:MAG: succinyl-diaminopimelate desuccinylase [Chromatiales bacterium]|nr:succinyl-diaminopimelate desuccinylase [Chromatiales bacterium]
MSASATDTLALTCELIRRASVTPEDAGCQQLLGECLAGAGFTLESMPFGEVTNLWATHGSGGPVLCFAGHTDVVPAGPEDLWHTPPFEPVLRDGMLYGRGAADMKASLAAMVHAATRFCREHPDHPGTIAFLVTSDEEGRAREGTLKVMEALAARGQAIDWCVVGEPSCSRQLGDTIRIGRRGSLSGMLTVHGRQGHVAYPQLADNPIQRFAPVLAELYAEPLDEGNEFFPPSSFQVVRLESQGAAVNVTPAELRTRFNFRYSTVWNHERLKQHVESLLQSHGVEYTLDWHLSGEPFLTPGGPLVEAVAAAVRETTGLDPERSTGGGTSDGRFIAPYGTHVVEFGAINTTIHKPNEEIPVAHIETLRETYGRILERMLQA